VDYQVRPGGSPTLLARPSHQDRTDSLKAGLCKPGAASVPNAHLHVFKRPAPFFKRPTPFVQTPSSICSNAPLHRFKRSSPMRRPLFSVMPPQTPQISCDSAEYMAFVFLGTLGVIAVPVGVPGVSLLLLVMKTRELRETDAQVFSGLILLLRKATR
jgi:hypothetical protein